MRVRETHTCWVVAVTTIPYTTIIMSSTAIVESPSDEGSPEEILVQAKQEIMECEKQSAAIKAILRGLATNTTDEDEENSLKVTLVKVRRD